MMNSLSVRCIFPCNSRVNDGLFLPGWEYRFAFSACPTHLMKWANSSGDISPNPLKRVISVSNPSLNRSLTFTVVVAINCFFVHTEQRCLKNIEHVRFDPVPERTVRRKSSAANGCAYHLRRHLWRKTIYYRKSSQSVGQYSMHSEEGWILHFHTITFFGHPIAIEWFSPFRLNTACVFTSHALVIEPLAESPSVMKIVDSCRSICFVFRCTAIAQFLLCKNCFCALIRKFWVPRNFFSLPLALMNLVRLFGCLCRIFAEVIIQFCFYKIIGSRWIAKPFGSRTREPNLVFRLRFKYRLLYTNTYGSKDGSTDIRGVKFFIKTHEWFSQSLLKSSLMFHPVLYADHWRRNNILRRKTLCDKGNFHIISTKMNNRIQNFVAEISFEWSLSPFSE